MHFARACYVVALGTLAVSFSAGMLGTVFGEQSLIPLALTRYLDASILPMGFILFAALLYQAMNDKAFFVIDTIIDTYLALIVPLAIVHLGITLAKGSGVSLTMVSEQEGMTTWNFFFTVAFGLGMVSLLLAGFLLAVQMVVYLIDDR